MNVVGSWYQSVPQILCAGNMSGRNAKKQRICEISDNIYNLNKNDCVVGTAIF